jgi:hypothetical protein
MGWFVHPFLPSLPSCLLSLPPSFLLSTVKH